MFRTHFPKATAVTIFVKAWAEELEHVGGPTMQQGLLSDFGITDEDSAEFVTQDISIFFSSRVNLNLESDIWVRAASIDNLPCFKLLSSGWEN